MQKLRVQLEMVGRVPINNGTFFDTLDGQSTKQLMRLIASAVSQSASSAGATIISLDNVPFKANEYVTIFDDEQSETVKISLINDKNITVNALTKQFKKGAHVKRTSAGFNSSLQEIQFGAWGTYSVSIMEVV